MKIQKNNESPVIHRTLLYKSFVVYYAPRKISGEHIVAALSVSLSVSPICVRPITSLFDVGFQKYFTEMITILRRCVVRKSGSLPWRSISQHDLAAKSCLANNFVIWSRISKIFHKNDHHIDAMCCAQHLGLYLEGQGHSMTFQQNSFRPITLWFEVEFYNYITDNVLHATFGLLPWRPRSQHDRAAKSCLAQKFVI